jgi:hypothetical protein
MLAGDMGDSIFDPNLFDVAFVTGEQRVNTTTHSTQSLADVAMAADRSYIAVWTSQAQDGSGAGVYGQRFDALGNKVAGEFRANVQASQSQQSPAVAVRDDGQFLVAWESQKQDGSGWGVFAREFRADGTPVGNEFLVNSTTSDDQRNPSVSYLADNGFVIAWEGKGKEDGSGVFARIYNASGQPATNEILVNQTTSGSQFRPSVDSLGGGFIVAWDGKGAGDSDGVFARVFNAQGQPAGSEFRLNATTRQAQESVDLVPLSDTQFAAVWQSKQQDGFNWGIYVSR